MFRTELGRPIRYEAGFFDFFDESVLSLLKEHRQRQGSGARFIAHHVIAPALAPSDKVAFRQMAEGTMDAGEVVGSGYKSRILTARSLGCATTRLQITQENRESVPQDGAFLTWLHDICEQAHVETGEGCKVTWWDEQKKQMAAALANNEGAALFQEFTGGIEQDFPVGGHWTLYGDEMMREPLVIAEVMYSRGGDEAVFEGFITYRPDQLTSETQHYVNFWRNVHASSQESMTLLETVPVS
jgi:hypothetical protein